MVGTQVIIWSGWTLNLLQTPVRVYSDDFGGALMAGLLRKLNCMYA